MFIAMADTRPMAVNYTDSTSVWEETAIAAPATATLSADASCDVAVIGAGYTGLNAALRLAEAGRSVIVLDAADVGHGASGRNGGQVVPGLKHDPDTLMQMDASGRLLDFAANCADELFTFIRQRGLNCDAIQSGWVQPATTEAQLRVVSSRAAQWRRSRDVPTRLLDRSEIRKLTGTPAYIGGWFDPRGGSLQPLSYVRELARVATEAGARLLTGTAADALQAGEKGWQVMARSHTVSARHVLLTTNGSSGGLARGLSKSFFPAHSVQIATEPLPASIRETVLPSGLPVSDARRLLKYFRLDRDGRFIIGGRGSFGARERGHHFEGLRQVAVGMFPVLRDVRWTHRWAGKIALTLDHLPHVHNPATGLYAALGYNGRGVAMASRTGVLLAELCLGKPHAESPLPVRPVVQVPFHAFRRPAMETAVTWYRLLDRLGA